MGIARRKFDSDIPRPPLTMENVRRVARWLPQVKGAKGFRLVSYFLVALAAIMPALVWNSLSIPGDTWSEPSLPFYGPFVLILGILILETTLILWIKMLQFGNERVWRRRKQGNSAANDLPPRHAFVSTDASQSEGAGFVAGRPRVLVVDDDPINRMILRKQLIRLKVEPVSAADGMEALDTVQRGQWDMILMDGQMPRLDGPETAHEIRLRELLPAGVPIVGISTDDTLEFRERCLKAGMQACYHKPVRRFVIEKLVDVYINQRVAEDPVNVLERATTNARRAMPPAS